MSIDYAMLGNASSWYLFRLLTDADRKRVVESLANSSGDDNTMNAKTLHERLKQLAPRFCVARTADGVRVMRARQTITLMVGPMGPAELVLARGGA